MKQSVPFVSVASHDITVIRVALDVKNQLSVSPHELDSYIDHHTRKEKVKGSWSWTHTMHSVT